MAPTFDPRHQARDERALPGCRCVGLLGLGMEHRSTAACPKQASRGRTNDDEMREHDRKQSKRGRAGRLLAALSSCWRCSLLSALRCSIRRPRTRPGSARGSRSRSATGFMCTLRASAASCAIPGSRDSARAGIPPLETCMLCHQRIIRTLSVHRQSCGSISGEPPGGLGAGELGAGVRLFQPLRAHPAGASTAASAMARWR